MKQAERMVAAEKISLTEEQVEEMANFKARIDDATVEAIEKTSSSKAVGYARRLTLVAAARDAETLTLVATTAPDAFGEMRENVDQYLAHVKALLAVAEAASIRMAICDVRNEA